MQNSYNKLSKALHWITALIVLGLLSMGFFMTLMEFSPTKLNIYMIHKSFGMTVLGLVIARILWNFFNPKPKSLETHSTWEKALSKIVHILLYFGLIAMPLSGWVMSSSGEYPVNYFGLFDFPALTGKDEQLFELTKVVHELGGYALISAIGLHFLGAAKHHLIDKDTTLTRMGGNIVFLGIGGLLLLSSLVIAQPHITKQLEQLSETVEAKETKAETQNAPASTQKTDAWTIDYDQSEIVFTFQQYGQAVNGTFEDFQGVIHFDPENLDQAKADIEIDINSIKTGSADRDEQAISNEWFSTEDHPTAHFLSESFSESEDDSYLAEGHLTVRGIKLPLSLPFSLNFSKDENGHKIADMRAEFSLNRLDFGVGQGEWESTEAIDNAVQINITVIASKNVHD